MVSCYGSDLVSLCKWCFARPGIIVVCKDFRNLGKLSLPLFPLLCFLALAFRGKKMFLLKFYEFRLTGHKYGY
jgi:hypothetical protein